MPILALVVPDDCRLLRRSCFGSWRSVFGTPSANILAGKTLALLVPLLELQDPLLEREDPDWNLEIQGERSGRLSLLLALGEPVSALRVPKTHLDDFHQL